MSVSSAAAATNATFQPIPRPNRQTHDAATLCAQPIPAADTASTSRPPISAGRRPMSSTNRPTTSTSAYMPTMWALITVKTSACGWPLPTTT